jgi:23S rRNA (cytosine1962-C5)-methyltransferase
MDPPKYGLGPKKERWEFAKGFEKLCMGVKELLSDNPLFIIVTAYGIDLQVSDLERGMKLMVRGRRGSIDSGKMMTLEKSAGRWLHHSIYTRWERDTVDGR